MFYRFFVDKYFLLFMLVYCFFIVYLQQICDTSYCKTKCNVNLLIYTNKYL